VALLCLTLEHSWCSGSLVTSEHLGYSRVPHALDLRDPRAMQLCLSGVTSRPLVRSSGLTLQTSGRSSRSWDTVLIPVGRGRDPLLGGVG
jgi:hypothetical protein